VFLPGYQHYLRTAAALQWDEASVDLCADAAAWSHQPPALQERLLRLLCGFWVGEQCVAGTLEPFASATDRPDVAACFRAQAVDEARHARFFDRVLGGVAGVTAAARRDAARGRLEPAFLELFDDRLPAAARGLAVADGALVDAVGLYHMLLEGIVFMAGVNMLLVLLERHEDPLPRLRRGVELVLRDERWHIGFGARLLANLGLGEQQIARLLAEGRLVASAWGDVIEPETVARTLALHRRRLLSAQASSVRVAP